MTFRRGFKTQSSNLVADVRAEVGLDLVIPLDPYTVASEYGVPIKTTDQLLNGTRQPVPSEFSAMTVFRGSKRIIVVNADHAPTRQRSSLAHELAHLLLEHEPLQHFANGARMWDPAAEREADWTGGELLIPREAALAICRRGEDVEAAAGRYGVSGQLMEWRLNASGARKQAERGRKRWRR